MSNRLRHRGPDDDGWLSFCGHHVNLGRGLPADQTAEVVIAHRRLSILDLSEAGRQPMASADGRYHIVFNGEIYNYLELRGELESQGAVFRTRTDTEVLLQAFAVWGKAVLSRLVGMFAFGVLDTQCRRLFLARDFFGIKPLYYTVNSQRFAFASEVKALLALPTIGREVNPAAVLNYLWFGQCDHGAETMLREIRQLPPGHFLELSLDQAGAPRTQAYWSLDDVPAVEISFPEAAETLREMFLENIGLHLRSDVPVGMALSGGIDSSSIVMAVRHVGGYRQDLHSFSYVADDSRLNEERWVDDVARAAQSAVHKVRIAPEELVADLDDLIAAQDEPFASTSIYAQRRVFRLAQEAGVKVLLDGQGADEMLAGYLPYLSVRLGSLLRQGRWFAAGAFLRRAGQLPGTSAWQVLRGARGALLPAGLRRKTTAWLYRHRVPGWIAAEWFRSRGVALETSSADEVRRGLRPTLEAAIARTSLPSLLRYEDRNSMTFSIESRVPFLTPRLVEFVLGLPEEYILAPDGTSKHVFREAMRGLVPDAILNRRNKIGFETPEHSWLQMLRPWVDEVLASDAAHTVPALHHAALRRECAAVLDGRQRFDLHIWRCLNLIRWTEVIGATYP